MERKFILVKLSIKIEKIINETKKIIFGQNMRILDQWKTGSKCIEFVHAPYIIKRNYFDYEGVFDKFIATIISLFVPFGALLHKNVGISNGIKIKQ